MNRKSRFRRDVETMSKLASAGPKLVLAIVGSGLALALIQSRVGQREALEIVAWLSLLGATAVVVGAWALFSGKNLQILSSWFTYRPAYTTKTQLEQITGVMITVLLGLMLFTASWPFYYAIVYLFYSLVYFVGVHHLNNNIRWGIRDSRDRQTEPRNDTANDAQLGELYRQAYDAIQAYHLDRPHEQRIVMMGVIGLGAIAFAVLDVIGLLDWGQIAASFILAVTLILAEVTITIWRQSYYGQMADLEDHREAIQNAQDP